MTSQNAHNQATIVYSVMTSRVDGTASCGNVNTESLVCIPFSDFKKIAKAIMADASCTEKTVNDFDRALEVEVT